MSLSPIRHRSETSFSSALKQMNITMKHPSDQQSREQKLVDRTSLERVPRRNDKRERGGEKKKVAKIIIGWSESLDEHAEKINNLAGHLDAAVVESAKDYASITHFLVSDGKKPPTRTYRTMIAYQYTPSFVTIKWLIDSSKKKQALPCDISYVRRQPGPVLDGCLVHLRANAYCGLTNDEMDQLISAAGGKSVAESCVSLRYYILKVLVVFDEIEETKLSLLQKFDDGGIEFMKREDFFNELLPESTLNDLSPNLAGEPEEMKEKIHINAGSNTDDKKERGKQTKNEIVIGWSESLDDRAQKIKNLAGHLDAAVVESAKDYASITHFLVSDGKKPPTRTYRTMIAYQYTPSFVTIKWLIDSFNSRKVLSCEKYTAVNVDGRKPAEDVMVFSTVLDSSPIRSIANRFIGDPDKRACLGDGGTLKFFKSLKSNQVVVKYYSNGELMFHAEVPRDPSKQIFGNAGEQNVIGWDACNMAFLSGGTTIMGAADSTEVTAVRRFFFWFRSRHQLSLVLHHIFDQNEALGEKFFDKTKTFPCGGGFYNAEAKIPPHAIVREDMEIVGSMPIEFSLPEMKHRFKMDPSAASCVMVPSAW